jgi:hypothetical protein
MPDDVEIATLTIRYTLRENGDAIVSHDIDGDIGLATLLGLLELTRDTLLHPPDHDE